MRPFFRIPSDNEKGSTMTATILLVDDDAEIRELLELLLSGEGYAVLQTESGEAALALLKQGANVDLIVLDVMMPGLSGYKTCALIREISNAPILFLTARSMDTDLTLGFSAGGDDYLAKPFSNAELLSRVKPFCAATMSTAARRRPPRRTSSPRTACAWAVASTRSGKTAGNCR